MRWKKPKVTYLKHGRGQHPIGLLDILYTGAESNVNVGDVFACVQLLLSSVELEH